MACIDDIVTLGLCPDEAVSKSGFTLLKAPGISVKTLANIANENYVSGADLAMEKKALTLLQFQNDFIGALQANKVVTTISDPVYSSSVFNTNSSVGTYAGERGVTLHKNNSYKGNLRKTILKSIQCYPLASGDGVIKIYDGYNEYTWDVTFVANTVNTFDKDSLSGLPFTVSDNVHAIKILIDQTDIAFASSPITCLRGCDNTAPNPCGWVDGWDGEKAVKAEGYGLNIQFYCHCDYEQIICDLSNSFTGELIWLKWQINIFEEQYKTNRFNNWVIYNRDDIEKHVLPDLENKYAQKWNSMMQGMLGILNTYRDECLNCRGIRWKTNI